MFGSDHAGERASAALMADKIVRQVGLRWADVLMPAALPAPTGGSIKQQIARALRSSAINAWEKQFLSSIIERESLSSKQRSVLERILRKVGAR